MGEGGREEGGGWVGGWREDGLSTEWKPSSELVQASGLDCSFDLRQEDISHIAVSSHLISYHEFCDVSRLHDCFGILHSWTAGWSPPCSVHP